MNVITVNLEPFEGFDNVSHSLLDTVDFYSVTLDLEAQHDLHFA